MSIVSAGMPLLPNIFKGRLPQVCAPPKQIPLVSVNLELGDRRICNFGRFIWGCLTSCAIIWCGGALFGSAFILVFVFVGTTFGFVGTTCGFVGTTCGFVGTACGFVGTACGFVGTTLGCFNILVAGDFLGKVEVLLGGMEDFDCVFTDSEQVLQQFFFTKDIEHNFLAAY